VRGVTEGSWRRRASQAGSAIVPALLVECASNLWITPASVNPPRLACMFSFCHNHGVLPLSGYTLSLQNCNILLSFAPKLSHSIVIFW
jgi:hypothetical protein